LPSRRATVPPCDTVRQASKDLKKLDKVAAADAKKADAELQAANAKYTNFIYYFAGAVVVVLGLLCWFGKLLCGLCCGRNKAEGTPTEMAPMMGKRGGPGGRGGARASDATNSDCADEHARAAAQHAKPRLRPGAKSKAAPKAAGKAGGARARPPLVGTGTKPKAKAAAPKKGGESAAAVAARAKKAAAAEAEEERFLRQYSSQTKADKAPERDAAGQERLAKRKETEQNVSERRAPPHQPHATPPSAQKCRRFCAALRGVAWCCVVLRWLRCDALSALSRVAAELLPSVQAGCCCSVFPVKCRELQRCGSALLLRSCSPTAAFLSNS
jgi:hypothetical protein